MGRFMRRHAHEYLEDSGWIAALDADADAELGPPPDPLVRECEAALERQRAGIPSPDAAWGWKNPRSIYLLPVIRAALPAARTVQLVRDGRDMAYSENQNQLAVYGELLVGDLGAAPEPVRSVALWSRVNLAALAFARRFGGHHLVLRYEDLCDEPEDAARRLLAHAELPETPALLAEASALVRPSSSAGRWREAPAAELEAVSATGEEALREFGYAPG